MSQFALLAELTRHPDLLRRVIRHAPASIAIFDREMRCLAVSERYRLEYDLQDDPVGKNHYDVFPNLPEHYIAAHRRVLDGEEVAAGDDSYVRADGVTVYNRWECHPWRTEQGEIGGMVLFTGTLTERRRAENLLNQTQQLAGIGGWEFDVRANHMTWSDQLYRVYGVEPGSIDPRSPEMQRVKDACLDPETRSRHREAVRCCVEEGVPYDMEFIMTDPAGRLRWMRELGTPLFEAGRVVRVAGFLMDVTDRRLNEEALRRSENLLSQTQQLAGIGAWEWEPGIRRMRWSEELYRIFGAEPGELSLGAETHRLVISCYDPRDRDRLDAAFRACIDGGVGYDLEAPLTDLKGRRKWVRTLGRPLVESGAVRRVIGFVMDLTNRRLVEEALRRSDNLLNEIQSLGNVGGWELDLRTDRLTWSDQVYRILGVEPGALDPNKAENRGLFRDRFDPPAGEQISQNLERCIHNAEPFDFESGFTDLNGRRRWVRGLVRPFLEDGEVVRLIGCLIDDTERRRLIDDYRMLFNEMLNGFAVVEIIHDASGAAVDYRYLTVNPAFERLTGYPAADLIGRTGREILGSIDEALLVRFDRVARTGEPFTHVYHMAGLGRDFESSVFRPAPGQAAVVFRDVTDRLRAERSLQEQLDELRRWHAVFADREDRILELKAEVNDALIEAGKAPRYSVAGARPGHPLADEEGVD